VNPVYIRATGLHSEHFHDNHALYEVLNQDKAAPSLTGQDYYQPLKVRLTRSELGAIAREDRSILNDLATSILNATGDLLVSANLEDGLPQAEDTPLYSGTDGVSEYSFTALAKLIDQVGSPEKAMTQLGILSGMTNPINMMRFLSTNPVYHTSKRLGLRGGGYPLRGMSLSGLYAIEDAVSDIASGRTQQGYVVAAGSMRNFDSLVVFGKMGLLGEDGEPGDVSPSYGSAVLLLDNNTQQQDSALAQVQWVSTRYNSAPFPTQEDWHSLMLEVQSNGHKPDVIVSYCNGVKANDENELAAIDSVFPDAAIKNYKSTFGYTSKANNALDLIAALTDQSIPVGANILINAAGFNVGTGYMVIKKLNHWQPKSDKAQLEGAAA
jgi:3-oxoacyl-(acyl-carrier-protein) synthase